MKRSIFAASLISSIALTTAIALPVKASGLTHEQKAELCGLINQVSAKIMTQRQQHVPDSRIRQYFTGPGSELYQGIITEAYKAPVYKTEQARKDVVQGFANKMEKICWEEF